MRACRIIAKNFRGIKQVDLLLPTHGVFIGDNNTGKTTILEALDLVLGPDRLNRQPPIDEHDFFRGIYIGKQNTAQNEKSISSTEEETSQISDKDADAAVRTPQIEIEVTITDLNEEQRGRLGGYIEFWDAKTNTLYDKPNPAGVDAATIAEALRVTFQGWYDEEEDDFAGKTYFTRSLTEAATPEPFTKKHKQLCGFLYLRSLRTGSRALSLERGSLLDIILRLNEVRPQMWEATLAALSPISVASAPELGISPVLESINTALKKYVPKEWGIDPHLKVSNLTREHLRKIITAFIATGDTEHSAPFYRQGTGTINMLVLALLSQIAEKKQNVIFAMEEPETAIPPYSQKSIVHEVRKLASQTLFTSHSPYVLEEFAIDETIVLTRDVEGIVIQQDIVLPERVKLKRYRQDFRTRFCEGLLARRILLAEGATEASAFPAVCRRLAELRPDTYSSLEALGICVIDAGGDGEIPRMAQFYTGLGKRAFALCDHQDDHKKHQIESQVDCLLMHENTGFEDMVLEGTTTEALARFVGLVNFPQHLRTEYPDPKEQSKSALKKYFIWSKADWGIADFLAQCNESEVPEWLRNAALKLKEICLPPAEADRGSTISTKAEVITDDTSD